MSYRPLSITIGMRNHDTESPGDFCHIRRGSAAKRFRGSSDSDKDLRMAGPDQVAVGKLPLLADR